MWLIKSFLIQRLKLVMWWLIWPIISFSGNTFMIIGSDRFLTVSYGTTSLVIPHFLLNILDMRYVVWRRNTRDYSTNMRACRPNNGCYALLEELANYTERNVIEYADINQQMRPEINRKVSQNYSRTFLIRNVLFHVFAYSSNNFEAVGISFYILGGR